jgi:hypothetical protein
MPWPPTRLGVDSRRRGVSNAQCETVQARMRHASARTTLDCYGHLWPDTDESINTAIGAVIAARIEGSGEATADALRAKTP